MAEPTPNKFAQLKQFWQKGKKEEGEATTAVATTAAHRQLPPQATQAPAPTTTTAPAFDPYGATDDLSFVPEDEDEGVKVKNVESHSQAADSLYTMDEQFVEEKDEEETKGKEEKKDEGVAQAQASSPESLYATAETFVDEEVVVQEEDKAVATPKGTEEGEATPKGTEEGENRYAYTAAASDVAYAMDDEFNPEGDASSTSAPAPSYGADSSAFQDIYGMADELNKGDDNIYARKEYSATPYEVFQTDSPSAAYYSGAIDEVLAEDNETNKSLYGEDDEEIRVPSAYGTEDVEGVADDGDNKKEEAESDSDDDFTDSEDEDDVKKPRRDQTNNWNTDFQHLLDMPPSAEKFTKLARLAHDFVFAAETYGKIIISELGLPVEKKTIKPVAAGGQAGGEKYIVQGIFFKFALDIFGIYGGDEYAMKAASHDLKGLIHYYSCQIPGLHVPLMALIDYLGFRLIAITILPINNATIKYGSCDAGQTVYADDPRLNEMMEQAGRKMKLQGHYVGVPGGMRRKLYAPVDIEGHKGLDGRYYVVDFARTFPPERPSPANMKRKGIILFNLLRPELVKSNDVPLTPDAFTLWAKADENKDLYNTRVTEATRRLLHELIPAVAAKLDEMQRSAEKGSTHLDLIEVIHAAGVNVRHLGYIRRKALNEQVQDMIMVEMIARVVRKQLQEKFRKKTRFAGIPTEEPQKLSAVKYLNKLLGRHHTSTLHWRLLKRALLFKFAKCLLDHELDDSYDLRKRISVTKLFKRLQKLAPNIFVLTEEARKDFGSAVLAHEKESWDQTPPDFKFLPSDLMPLAASIKHMNLIDIAEASAMFYGSLDEKGNDQVRLLIQGLGKFQIAARKMPFIDADTVVALGDMLVSRAKACKAEQHRREAEYQSALSGALIAFQTALNINPQNVRCLMGLGDIHLVRGEDHEAREKYQEAINAEPSDAEAYVKLASTYGTPYSYSNGGPDGDGKIRETALRKALECDPQHVGALICLGDILLDRATRALDAKEEFEQFADEAGSLYGLALVIKPDDYASYEALCSLISFLSKSGGSSKNSTLKLLWSLTKSNEHLKKLCMHEFAKLKELHLGQLSTISDLVFNLVAGNASSATGLFFNFSRAEEGVIPSPAEATVRDWLLAHPKPLLHLHLVKCPQLGDELLKALGSSIHRQSLQTLSLAGTKAITNEALVQLFQKDGENQADTWPSLTELDFSSLPAVNKEVLAAVAIACPALTTLKLQHADVGDEVVEVLPSQLTTLFLGGQYTKDALYEAFTQRLTSLVNISFANVDVLSFADVYSLATALPNLRWCQYPRGEVNHWSGNSSVAVKFTERGATMFQFDEVTYQIINNGATTSMASNGVHVNLQGSMAGRFCYLGANKLFDASHSPHAGWVYKHTVPGARGVASIKYNQQMKLFHIAPAGIATVQVMPFANCANITILPRQDITLNLAAIYLAFAHK